MNMSVQKLWVCSWVTPRSVLDVLHVKVPNVRAPPAAPCTYPTTLLQPHLLQAPWMLSVIEVLSLLLLYGLLILPYRPPGPYAFDFKASTEDVVLLGGIRAATLAATYAWGSTRQHLRWGVAWCGVWECARVCVCACVCERACMC
jgi:hypothetical protein